MQRLRLIVFGWLLVLLFSISPFEAAAQVSRSVGNISDTFEYATLDPSWRIVTLLNETVAMSTDQNHTPAGLRSLSISPTGPGQRNAYIQRTLGGLTKGTGTIYFYDSGPGFYAGFELVDTATGVHADIGAQDFDPTCYRAFVYLAADAVYGPNETCGPFPRVETTNVHRTVGWHKLTIASTSQGVTLSIDDQAVFTLAGSFAFDTAQLLVVGPHQTSMTYYFDDFSFSPPAECDVLLSSSTYGNGDAVVVSTLHMANHLAHPLPVELKLWLGVPGVSPISVVNLGANGSLVLPTGFEQTSGPFTLFQVAPSHPRGAYEFGCRSLSPVTGELLAEGIRAFTIQ